VFSSPFRSGQQRAASSACRPRRASAAAAVAVAALLAVLLAGCGGSGASGAPSGDGGTWIHGIVTPKGDAGFILMAQERKLYEQQGIHVEIKPFVGNVQLVQALVSGSIDSAEMAPDPVFDAVNKGGDLKIIGSTLPGLTYVLAAKASIPDFDALQGKSIGVSAPGALPDAVTRAMLGAKGLDPHDLKVVNAGDDAQRFKALLAGRVDAAAVSPEFVPEIEENSELHVLAQAQDLVPKYPRFMITANGDALERKPNVAVRFLAAEMLGVSYASQHRDAEIALTAKTLDQPPSSPGFAVAYDEIEKAKAASPTSEIPMDKLRWLQDFRSSHGLQKQRIDLSALVDGSFREKALDRVRGQVGAGS
jgi:NitT/TauT family transport system substrate-binding protein